jgi:virulence-associated protein VagC
MKKLVLLTSILLLTLMCTAQMAKEDFTGKYQVRPGFDITITVEGSDLFVEPTGKPKEKLNKVDENRYAIASIGGEINFEYVKNRDEVQVNMYGQMFHAPKHPLFTQNPDLKEIELDKDVVQKIIGEYKMSEKTTVKIEAKDDGIFAQLSGQPAVQIYPFDMNKFFYKVVPAYIEFIQENSKTKFLLLHQSGVIVRANKFD